MSGAVRPKFGVVVLTMGNRPVDLNRGLASLLNQREVDLDVVVVGNGWQPISLPEGVKAHGLSENLGIPAGRNAGVGLVQGDLLFFLDDDACLPEDDILTRMAQNESKPEKPEELFFVEVKSRVVHAYYTSEIGIKQEMEYRGNTFQAEFSGIDVSQER